MRCAMQRGLRSDVISMGATQDVLSLCRVPPKYSKRIAAHARRYMQRLRVAHEGEESFQVLRSHMSHVLPCF